jgi:hypothetical protein
VLTRVRSAAASERSRGRRGVDGVAHRDQHPSRHYHPRLRAKARRLAPRDALLDAAHAVPRA